MSHKKKVRFLFYSGDGVFKNDHIFKEHGAIIDHFNKHGYDAKMVCIDHGQLVSAHHELGKEIDIKYLKDTGSLFDISFAFLRYLFSVKNIDTLILTHFSPKTLFYANWYRIFHRKGKIYVKGDFDAERFKRNDYGFTRTSSFKWLEKLCFRWFMSMMNLVTVETKQGLDYLHAYDPERAYKIKYMPNGFDEEFIEKNDLKANYDEKKNTIVTIGRIGTHQKNTEMLLEILSQIDLKDWQVNIIGTIEPGFQQIIDLYFERHPELREKINFTGPIYDRKELFRYLHEAKLYLCTSRFEGFSLVFTELLSQGVALLTTPVSGSDDITDNGRVGTILENREAFVHTLQKYINDNIYNKDLFEKIVHHAYKHFTWKENLKKLEHLLEQSHL